MRVELTLDMGPAVRRAMIEYLADVVNTVPQYRMAVILQLLREDAITRCLLAEELGEQAYKERDADAAAQAELDLTDFQSDAPAEKSWDQIMLEVIERLENTPGGRGEVV